MLKTQSRIQVKTNKPIYLVPFGDLHYGHRDCNIKEFERMLRENNRPDTYFIGVGDIFDSIVMRDIRFQLSQLGGMDGKGFVDDFMDEMANNFGKLWRKHKIPSERILFMGIGNHESNMMKRYSVNPLKQFCLKEKITYGAYSGYHTVTLIVDGNHKSSFHIRYHHGYGGGARTGGYPLTKYEKELMWSDADVFVFGHDHRRHLQPYSYEKMSNSGGYCYKRRRILAICGGFLENRPMTEYPSYAEEKMYPASDIGYIRIPVVVKAKSMDGGRKNVRRYVDFPVYE